MPRPDGPPREMPGHPAAMLALITAAAAGAVLPVLRVQNLLLPDLGPFGPTPFLVFQLAADPGATLLMCVTGLFWGWALSAFWRIGTGFRIAAALLTPVLILVTFSVLAVGLLPPSYPDITVAAEDGVPEWLSILRGLPFLVILGPPMLVALILGFPVLLLPLGAGLAAAWRYGRRHPLALPNP